MSHKSNPPKLSDECLSRKCVMPHDGKRSVNSHNDFSDPETILQYPNPGAGSGAGSDGPPTTGGDESGIPEGFS
jgi:hypothetical protein